MISMRRNQRQGMAYFPATNVVADRSRGPGGLIFVAASPTTRRAACPRIPPSRTSSQFHWPLHLLHRRPPLPLSRSNPPARSRTHCPLLRRLRLRHRSRSTTNLPPQLRQLLFNLRPLVLEPDQRGRKELPVTHRQTDGALSSWHQEIIACNPPRRRIDFKSGPSLLCSGANRSKKPRRSQ
jgi:hypothetical protein